MEHTLHQREFEKAWSTVRRRVGRVSFLLFVRKTFWIPALAAPGAVAFLRWNTGWQSMEAGAVTVVLLAWLITGITGCWASLPSRLDSLILLDRRGGWRDRFSSAWQFSQKQQPSDEEKAHIEASLPRLMEAAQAFPSLYAAPKISLAMLLLSLAVGLTFLPWGRPVPAPGDLVLTPRMKEVAGEQAAALESRARQMKDMESLTEEEKAELEALRVAVAEMADSLADPEGLTAGAMLEALEERARAADKLAERLGLADNAWASPEMLAEMARHADTVDIALTITDREAEAAAVESMKLREVLDSDSIQQETRDRMTFTLEQIIAAATVEDGGRPVGERVGNASRKLSEGQPKTAAREFEELANHFRFLARRDEAREKLEEMASSLREAGSEVSGSELERMEEIASESGTARPRPGGLQAIEEGSLPEDLQKLLNPQVGSSGAGEQPPLPGGEGNQPSPEKKPAPVPGVAKKDGEPGDGGEETSMALAAPVPGESPPAGPSGSSGQRAGASDQAQDGKGEGGLLSAPVPGVDPAESGAGGAGASLAGNPAATPGQGGDQAGTGTAAMVDNETGPLEANRDGEVIAQINESGESSVRAVAGQARAEDATRSRQEIVAEFLSAEEQALDGKSIPISRREHVIRYFSAIRKQFEEAESKP